MADLKNTLRLRAFGLFNIPLLFSVRPTVLEINDDRSEVRIPLNRWTRNHLHSMYFGTLAIGADCSGGLLAQQLIRKSGKKISIIFKDFKANFLKRAEGDVHFHCEDGKKIQKQIQETIRDKKRTNHTLHITATTPKVSGDEPIAHFELTLSLKLQQKK